MPKKEVFLTKEQIEYIDKNHKGKYSEFGRIAVQEKIERESGNNALIISDVVTSCINNNKKIHGITIERTNCTDEKIICSWNKKENKTND